MAEAVKPKFDEAGYPTDAWARKIRMRFEEGTPEGPRNSADLQRAQLEAVARKMDEGQSFAQATGHAPKIDVAGMDTRAKVEYVGKMLRAELAKPADQRDLKFIRRATATITAFKGGNVEVPEGTEQAFPGEAVDPIQREVPGQGEQVTVSPQQQLARRKMVMEAKNRGEDIVNFLKRPFLDDDEQTALANELRVSRAEEQIQLEADAQASGVDVKNLEAAGIVGTLAPDLVGGAAAGGIPFARTLGGAAARVATEAGMGSVLGGSTVPLDENPINAALIDGGITLGLGTMTELPGLATDFLRREVRAARNSSQDRHMQEISQATGLDLTIGERTQVPSAMVAETNVPARPEGPRAQFLAARKEQLRSAFNAVESKLNPDSMSPTEVIAGTRRAYDDTISGMSALASQQFRNNMDTPLKGVGARMDVEGRIHGGFKFIQPTELVSELQTQRRLLADQPLSDANRFALRDLDMEISRLKKGGLDLGQTQRLLSDLSSRNAPTGIVIKDNTRAGEILNSGSVQRALNRDLDRIAADANAPEEFVNAINGLQDARREFAMDRAQIDVFKNHAVDKLLGKIGDPTSADFAGKVLKLDAGDFNTMLRIADDADPRLGNAIRATTFKEMIDKHTSLGVIGAKRSRTAQDIDVPGLMAEINRMPMSKFMAFTGTDMSLEDARHLRNTMTALQAMAEGPTKSAQHSATIRNRAEQWAINAASRDVGFVSRLLAGEMAPGMIERMLFTKKGQDALSNLSRPKVIAPQIAQAFTYFSTAMSEDEKAQAELQKQRVREGLDDPKKFRSL